MPSKQQSVHPASAAPLRVLLVEDEIMVAMLLEDMLAALGHAVVGPVTSVAKALEIARSEPLDVAILDVNLNGMEVYPVAEVLGARDIPFVFATGYGNGGLSPLYRGRPILSKPFLRRHLSAALARACPAK